jgi:RNA polymerase sigma-70 factor (ECF subfamily)
MAMVSSTEKPASDAAIMPFPRDRYADAKLVERAAAGDHSAVSLAWERYARLVRGTLIGALGPDSAVDDLMQEVFLAFFRSAAKIKDPGALRSYLVGIAMRLAALEIRKRKVLRLVGLSPTGELPDVEVAPEDQEGRQTLRALYRVLDQLSTRRRLAFVLRHVQGLELSEIVVSLEISESTVRRELRRAERQLSALAGREPALLEYLEKRGLSGRTA